MYNLLSLQIRTPFVKNLKQKNKNKTHAGSVRVYISAQISCYLFEYNIQDY